MDAQKNDVDVALSMEDTHRSVADDVEQLPYQSYAEYRRIGLVRLR